VNDTNILYRATPDTLDRVQQMARRVLESDADKDRSARYADLIDYCRHARVSPGGSADLLAVTVFFYDVEATLEEDIP
jgi:triphosphoribosyl-dephospho-CoA synthetase